MKRSNKGSLVPLLVYRNEISKVSLFKTATSILVILALISFEPSDPSPFNLFLTANGTQNLLGLPGALLAGFLIEMFGYLGYLVPLLITFFGRKKAAFNFKLVFPELLETLSLVAIVALILPPDYGNRLQLAGLWGQISSEQLIAFPGQLFSLLVLGAYQLVYFRQNRFDLSLFSILSLLFFFVYRFVGYLLKLINRNIGKSSKYYVVNWITPLGYAIVRQLETLAEKAKSGIVQLRYRFAQVDLLNMVTQPFRLLRFKKDKSGATGTGVSQHQTYDLPTLDRTLIMERTFIKYNELYHEKDQRAFLVHEEEIIL